jgi:hypothetical protein
MTGVPTSTGYRSSTAAPPIGTLLTYTEGIITTLVDPTAVRALVLVEPGGCRATQFTDEQIATLATKPILVVFGDNLDAVTGSGFS